MIAGSIEPCEMTCQYTACYELWCIEAENVAAPFSFHTKEEQKVTVCFCGQMVLKWLKFRHVYVLSYGTVHYLTGVYVSGETCLIKVRQV